MTGIYGFSFTLPQMVEAMTEAYLRGKVDGVGSSLELESVAFVICEAANLPMIEVLSALQRLEEWRSSQRDHP
jgi:hypothetical protein